MQKYETGNSSPSNIKFTTKDLNNCIEEEISNIGFQIIIV
jgi:hypothetical protein